jgi:sugar phosphate isomerase/epimerase
MAAAHTVTRRTVLQAAVALASLRGAGAYALGSPRKYRMGLQLYTVREPMDADPVATLDRVHALGYRELETYGFAPDGIQFYGMHARAFRTVLDDLGLSTMSGHYDFGSYLHRPLAEFITYADRCIEGALALGQKYVTWPWLGPESRTLDAFQRVAERLNVLGERARQTGISAAYHNHGFEFEDLGGATGFDIVSRETDPALVKLQLDLFWVAHASPISAAALIAAQPGRFVMWHIKDMDAQKRYTELGHGVIDFPSIMPHARTAGLEYLYVEQGDNFAVDPLHSIATSAQYVREQLSAWIAL